MPGFDPGSVISRRTGAVEEAAIIRMAQKARDLKAAGKPVVSLTLGEPDFDTPQFIQQAATDAMAAGYTHYAPISGIPELRKAISNKLAQENDVDYAASCITMSNGAKQSITSAAFALLDEGDEVILPAPFWAAYEGIVRMAGGVPVVLPSSIDSEFKITASQLAAALTGRSKLLVINSPSNPSGVIYSRQELEQLAEVVRGHPSLMVLSDEIYEYIVFDKPHVSIASLPGMNERTIVINGFSKGYAMTGWRLGWSAAPEAVARAIGKVQGTFTAGANAFVQHAALAALQGPRESVDRMCGIYRQRRDLVAGKLQAMPGLRCHVPDGTFYAFPDISAVFGKSAGNHRIETSDDLCNWLLDEHLVATVPGSAFGAPECMRLSFATSETELADGLDRIDRALRTLA